MKREDLSGRRFERLVVTSFHGSIKYHHHWECLCDCGKTCIARGSSLLCGDKKSCGCLFLDRIRQMGYQNRTHGQTRSPEYRSYLNARRRCNDRNRQSYKHYGGRGIEFRFESFQHFLDHIGKKPSPEWELDRIDNDGHYEPGNVRWVTRQQNMRNTRLTTRIEVDGRSVALRDYCEAHGADPDLAAKRRDKGKPQSEWFLPSKHKNHHNPTRTLR